MTFTIGTEKSALLMKWDLQLHSQSNFQVFFPWDQTITWKNSYMKVSSFFLILKNQELNIYQVESRVDSKW
jgi:hypothetical protein